MHFGALITAITIKDPLRAIRRVFRTPEEQQHPAPKATVRRKRVLRGRGNAF